MSKSELNYQSYLKPLNPSDAPAEKPWPKMKIDGQEIIFKPGDTIMQAAERAGIAADIPRYCYHPGLPIAGTCRMCTVEVEKAPKLMTSCSTPAGDGMVVYTKNDRVKKSRNGVMEFLLVNHPLDCPVCDKAGECELQNYNYEYGPGTSRFVEEKRVWNKATTKKLSDKITLNMNRCVHCERCVRFTEDVTKTHDLVMLNRGWKKELAATDEQKGVWNEYQGCLTDFCPVGALTFNDFRFQKRVWFLKKTPSICDGCSKGCNIEVHSDKEIIYRYVPKFNEQVNGHWMCDEGRVGYHHPMNPLRIISPMLKSNNSYTIAAVPWDSLISGLTDDIRSAQKPLIIIGTDATNEEASQLKDKFSKLHKNIQIFSYNGTNSITSSTQDEKLDNLLKMKDKTPNTRGLEKLGLKPLGNEHVDADFVIYVRFGRSGMLEFSAKTKVYLWGVWNQEEIQKVSGEIKGVIPGLATAEKNGTFISAAEIVQSFKAAIVHTGHAMNVDYVMNKLEVAVLARS